MSVKAYIIILIIPNTYVLGSC